MKARDFMRDLENGSNLKTKKKNTSMILAAFMIFILPIMLVFIGAFIGGIIGENMQVASDRTFQIVGGVIGFLLSAIIVKVFDKHSKADEKSEKIYWDDL
ncbi:Fis family transcriptional regulator [Clostridium sp. MF28]|nr:Fis family transcriptional regulator [Clostridium sp. MF28]